MLEDIACYGLLLVAEGQPYKPLPNLRFMIPIRTLCILLCSSFHIHAAVPDVTTQVQYLGTASGNFASKLIQHRNRLYFINGKQDSKSPSSYYDLSTGTFSTAGQIDTEAPYGAVIKQGDLLWYGEDTTDGFNGSVLHVITHSGIKRYEPPTANAHQQSQWIYDGKIFAADWNRSYPGAAISYDGGASWSNKRLAGMNGFKAKIDGLDPYGALVANFFEFRGNLFSSSITTTLDKVLSNGTRPGSSLSENFLMRYTGNPAKPWEVAIHRFSDMGFKGRPNSYASISSSTKPGFLSFFEFNGYLFVEWFGVVNRYSAQMVTSLDNPLVTYAKPTNPVVVANNIADSNGNVIPNAPAHPMSMVSHHGTMYLVVSPVGSREIRRSTDGVNWETICTINVASGSPLSSLADQSFFIEIVGNDIYFCTTNRRLYRIPASVMGANAPSGIRNTPPAASNDTFTSASVKNAFQGPLLNDSDVDGDAFYAEIVTPPASGTIDFRYNGTFDYTPATQTTYPVSFTYRVFDGVGYSAPATVTLNLPLTTNLDATGTVVFGDDSQGDSSQDGAGSAPSFLSISTSRYAATITRNPWKRFPLLYSVTPNTMLEFSVEATDVGEILGLILDDNTSATDNRRGFLVGGSDLNGALDDPWVWDVPGLERYTAGMGVKTYTIPVGTYFTGQVNYLVLVGDDDASGGSTNATFHNIRLREGTASQTYEQWKSNVAWGSVPEGQRGANDDPDGDGLTNASERAFGANPTLPDKRLGGDSAVTSNPDGSHVLKTFYHKGISGMNYVLQQSTTLSSWADVTTSPELFDSAKGLYYRTWNASANQPRFFTRIKAVDQ